MEHFLKRVREKALEPKVAPVLIVAFGDSVTQGAMEMHHFDPVSVYHRLLQDKLETFYPTTTFSTLNAGVSGSTASEAIERLDRDVVRHQPDLVLVTFGLNDSLAGIQKLPDFVSTLVHIVEKVRGADSDLILVTPSFMARRQNSRIHEDHVAFSQNIIRTQNDGTLAAYAEAIRSVAIKTGTPLADVAKEWERLVKLGVPVDDWFINGLNHPDSRGHRLAAETIFSVIKSYDD